MAAAIIVTSQCGLKHRTKSCLNATSLCNRLKDLNVRPNISMLAKMAGQIKKQILLLPAGFVITGDTNAKKTYHQINIKNWFSQE